MRILFVTLIVVIIDQVTKLLIKGIKIESLGIDITGMRYGQSKPLIGDIVRLTFIENPGMAFGIDIGPKMFLTIFTIVASLFILFYIYKHRNDGLLIRLSLGLILAGAVGNLIDRTFYGVIYGYAPLFHGKVVDFMQVEFWDFTIMGRTYTTWPIWNIADAAVSAGFLIILFFHNKIFKPETQPDTPELGNRDIPVEMENSANKITATDSGEGNISIDDEGEGNISITDKGEGEISITDPNKNVNEISIDEKNENAEGKLEEKSKDIEPVNNNTNLNTNGGFITDNSQFENNTTEEVTQKFYSEDTKKNVDPGPGGTIKDKD